MIAWVANQIRMARCEHEWEAEIIPVFAAGDRPGEDLPLYHKRIMTCRKCGYSRAKKS